KFYCGANFLEYFLLSLTSFLLYLQFSLLCRQACLSLFAGECRTKRIDAKPHSIRITETAPARSCFRYPGLAYDAAVSSFRCLEKLNDRPTQPSESRERKDSDECLIH
ncbi:hypothetical protein, partial [Alistipes putredinis]